MNIEKFDGLEIVRSYTRKVNLGNYETADHYSSWKAIVPKGIFIEDAQSISDSLAERAEEDVESKINPTKIVNRRVSLAELRSKLAKSIKRIEELEEIVNNIKPF